MQENGACHETNAVDRQTKEKRNKQSAAHHQPCATAMRRRPTLPKVPLTEEIYIARVQADRAKRGMCRHVVWAEDAEQIDQRLLPRRTLIQESKRTCMRTCRTRITFSPRFFLCLSHLRQHWHPPPVSPPHSHTSCSCACSLLYLPPPLCCFVCCGDC